MVGGNGENQFRQYAGQNVRNLKGYNAVQNVKNQVAQNLRVQNVGNQNGLIGVLGNANLNGNGNLVAARAEGNAAGHNGNQIRCYNYRGVADLDEIEEVNANYILMANLQQASTSSTQTGNAPVYDSDGSAENNNNVQSEVTSVEQSGETVEQHPVNFKETRALYDSLYQNLEIEVEKVNTVNCKLKETNADLTTELARFKNQEKCFEISQEKYDKLERCYQQMTLETHKWSSSTHQELHKIVKDENFPIVNQVDARVQNFEIQFLKEAAKFVGDFKSLAKEADDSLAKHKALELEIERLLRAVENEYAKLWNDWYKKCDECKFDKISYNKAYKDMQQKIKRLQAQLGDLKGKSKDTSCVSDTLNPLSQKLENENVELEFKVGEIHALSKPDTSNSVPILRTKSLKNDKVIAPGMFRINPFKTSREAKHVPNNVRASTKTKLITISQPSVITKKDVNSDSNGLSSTGIDNTKTRRPQPRSNTKNDRVPSASKSSRRKNKDADVEEHHRNLLLSNNTKHMSSACNNIKLDSQNVISKFVCAMCKQCLISVNHDVCLRNYVNGKTSCGKKQTANVSIKEKQKKHQPKFTKTKKVIQICLWCVDSGCSKHMTKNLKLLINFIWKFMGIVRFGNDHVAAILGFGDLQWGNILITRVYFVEGVGHNLFSVGQFCDSDLEFAFRRNACFVRNLEGVDLLKVDRSKNFYTINLHEMTSASPICLMARASSTKSWL
uniref:Integrase, catalytic region, zinc finger, CCHC-type, peptidase aspartic, catalytic n=1 Tax=Tanacetum cinerariifolium TaxID=118510 RepID=A0A6L2LMN7_TANCI|nr:integrase, catalytic region, zinc finger, CCHC-type, peptidase aspartic, catalytic [Tanacetum cinerariifolium]